MPRTRRILSDTGIYHIIIRGNNKQNIFYDDSDRILILKKIQKYSTQLNIFICAYCLMNNHVHLLVANANPNMSKFMLKLNTSYSRLFNIKYDRTGHLFQGRFLSKPVHNNTSYMVLTRYILKNSEKAGIAKYDEYIWNSFQCIINNKTFYKEEIYKIIHINKEFVLNMFNGIDNFIKFIDYPSDDICMDYEGVKKLSDSDCIKIIKKILNISNINQINKFQPTEISNYINILKTYGISQNQISRITGLSIKLIRSS